MLFYLCVQWSIRMLNVSHVGVHAFSFKRTVEHQNA